MRYSLVRIGVRCDGSGEADLPSGCCWKNGGCGTLFSSEEASEELCAFPPGNADLSFAQYEVENEGRQVIEAIKGEARCMLRDVVENR